MSTKAIREALLMLRTMAPPETLLEQAVDGAEAEVEAIENAAKALANEGCDERTNIPTITAMHGYINAIDLMKSIAKEANK